MTWQYLSFLKGEHGRNRVVAGCLKTAFFWGMNTGCVGTVFISLAFTCVLKYYMAASKTWTLFFSSLVREHGVEKRSKNLSSEGTSSSLLYVLCLVAWSGLTLCYPMDRGPYQAPLSFGILQAGIPQWVAISSSRGSSQPREQTDVSHTTGGFFTIWATRDFFIGYMMLGKILYLCRPQCPHLLIENHDKTNLSGIKWDNFYEKLYHKLQNLYNNTDWMMSKSGILARSL